MRNIFVSRLSWVAARRSAVYESSVCLERPMAFPISEERRLVFLLYARRAVSLASSSVNCQDDADWDGFVRRLFYLAPSF